MYANENPIAASLHCLQTIPNDKNSLGHSRVQLPARLVGAVHVVSPLFLHPAVAPYEHGPQQQQKQREPAGHVQQVVTPLSIHRRGSFPRAPVRTHAQGEGKPTKTN